jgi:hypothetical protein
MDRAEASTPSALGQWSWLKGLFTAPGQGGEEVTDENLGKLMRKLVEQGEEEGTTVKAAPSTGHSQTVTSQPSPNLQPPKEEWAAIELVRGSPPSGGAGHSPTREVTNQLRRLTMEGGHHPQGSNQLTMDGILDVSTVESHGSQEIVSPPGDGLASSHGEKGGLLTTEIAEKYSLNADAMDDINGHIQALLAAENDSAIKASEKQSKNILERENILEARIEGIKTDCEATVLAMHTRVEEKSTRLENHWQEPLNSLREENSKVYNLYRESVDQRRDQNEQRAQEHQMMSAMEMEIKRLKESSLKLQKGLEARQRLDAGDPEGFSGTDLVAMPDRVTTLTGGLLEARYGSSNMRDGEKGGGYSSQQTLAPKVAFNMPSQAGRTSLETKPPRYTTIVEGGGADTQRREPVLTGLTLGSNQPLYGDGRTPVSPITANENERKDVAPGNGGGLGYPAEEQPTDHIQEMAKLLQKLQIQQTEAMKQQTEAIARLKTDFSLEIDQKLNANRSSVEKEGVAREQKASMKRVDDCIQQFSAKHPTGPYASFLPRQQTEDDAQMMAKAASGNAGYEGFEDLPTSHAGGAGNRGGEAPRNSTIIQPGYLPTRFNVPKHEETAIGLFHGGEEARNKWPSFYANFEHLATSYGWGYELKGALLNRRSRDHALQVIGTLSKTKKMDYDQLVKVFNNAYIPSEWARAYRGSMNGRKQGPEETFLQYAAALRKLAIIAYPCTDPTHTDDMREQRCLDVYLNGIKDPHIAVFVTNKKPSTMEDAVSAAEAYTAVWARNDDLPIHPDQIQAVDTTAAAMVKPPTSNPKQQGAKPIGPRFNPKKFEGVKKASNGSGKEKRWDNPQSETYKMLKCLLEEMRKANPPRGDHTQRSQTFQNRDQKGQIKKPVYPNTDKEDLRPRCYRCQKPGHIKRDCRVNIGCVDECLATEWYCEEHAPDVNKGNEDF